MTQTEIADDMLHGTTARDYTFHLGKYAKLIPAGTEVMVRQEAVESGARYVYTYLASNPRCAEVLPVSGVIPA